MMTRNVLHKYLNNRELHKQEQHKLNYTLAQPSESQIIIDMKTYFNEHK